MPISWNEIRDRSLTFSHEWATECSEDAEAKSFWDGFFNIFGITRRRVASFEAPVKKGDGQGGFIDLLWKGVLLVEHKVDDFQSLFEKFFVMVEIVTHVKFSRLSTLMPQSALRTI